MTDDVLEHWKQHYAQFPLVGDAGMFAERVGWRNYSCKGRAFGYALPDFVSGQCTAAGGIR